KYKYEDTLSLMFVIHRKCLSGEQKARGTYSVFVSARGADLVIINSREEHFLLKVVGSGYFWIGLKKSVVWKWTDGATLANGYWRSRYPPSYSDCAQMSSTGWEDERCINYVKWICERTICTYSKINLSCF
uniref:C-type lectin domain-containing protein n=1 Tax=Sinocyclocheilus rhinocerous TaxID=307959 RepID=A0A673N7S2_9TELE